MAVWGRRGTPREHPRHIRLRLRGRPRPKGVPRTAHRPAVVTRVAPLFPKGYPKYPSTAATTCRADAGRVTAPSGRRVQPGKPDRPTVPGSRQVPVVTLTDLERQVLADPLLVADINPFADTVRGAAEAVLAGADIGHTLACLVDGLRRRGFSAAAVEWAWQSVEENTGRAAAPAPWLSDR